MKDSITSHAAEASPLGQATQYASHYDASLLFPIPRSSSRTQLGIVGALPFNGVDIWTGYELSWLNTKGKPQVAVAEFTIPCDSPCIIESKSFKLYLNSFNQTAFADSQAVQQRIQTDLSAVAGAPVGVNLQSLDDSNLLVDVFTAATCLDELDVAVDTYHPQPDFLSVEATSTLDEVLCSHLLKSNCPVTGQPDWASVFIAYRGKKIQHENLLKYIISFREHQDFHEHCVERMFVDIMQRCQPESLTVYARYTRRGGLDINPLRSTEANPEPFVGRLLRQ